MTTDRSALPMTRTDSPSLSETAAIAPTHELKVWPMYFDALASGEKSFEFRADDREPRFAVGQVLRLREYHPGCQSSHCKLNGCGFPQACPRDREGYTDRECSRLVTYVARGGVIPKGFCVMSVVPVDCEHCGNPIAAHPIQFTDKIRCDRDEIYGARSSLSGSSPEPQGTTEVGPLVDEPYTGDDLARWLVLEAKRRGRTRGAATMRMLAESAAELERVRGELATAQHMAGIWETTCAAHCVVLEDNEQELTRLRADARHHRWNIREDGESLWICRRDHESHEPCNEVEYTPRATKVVITKAPPPGFRGGYIVEDVERASGPSLTEASDSETTTDCPECKGSGTVPCGWAVSDCAARRHPCPRGCKNGQ